MSILEGKSYNYVALMAEKPNNHKGETKVRTATAIFQSILVESNKLNDHGNHLHEYYVQSWTFVNFGLHIFAFTNSEHTWLCWNVSHKKRKLS